MKILQAFNCQRVRTWDKRKNAAGLNMFCEISNLAYTSSHVKKEHKALYARKTQFKRSPSPIGNKRN